jgi:hypothetical protein
MTECTQNSQPLYMQQVRDRYKALVGHNTPSESTWFSSWFPSCQSIHKVPSNEHECFLAINSYNTLLGPTPSGTPNQDPENQPPTRRSTALPTLNSVTSAPTTHQYKFKNIQKNPSNTNHAKNGLRETQHEHWDRPTISHRFPNYWLEHTQ